MWKPASCDLLHHLDADDAAGLLELDALEDRPAHQPEVAVDVADRQPNITRDDVVVEPADDDPVQRIRPADLVAVDQIDVRRHARPAAPPVPPGRTARRRRCRRSAPWWPTGTRSAARRRSRDSSAWCTTRTCGYVRASSSSISRVRVRAAVVDDDHLVVGRQFRGGLNGADDHARDRAAVVVGREEDAQTGLRARGADMKNL